MKIGLASAGRPSSEQAILLLSKTRPKKKERSSVETKKRILDAAASEFAAKGFDGARLGSIARAADVQQALIHHYFADKEGLHAEVVRSGLEAMTQAAWELLSTMDAPQNKRKTTAKRPPGKTDVKALATAFVALILSFFATNGAFLDILRHEARRGAQAAKIVADAIGPVFEALVSRIEQMKKRGEVRNDLDAKHFLMSCIAMVAFPFAEESFVTAVWPADWHDKKFLAERKKQIVEMVLARALPRAR
jgi:TetR/AcrR family transcriptional regulator